MLAVSAAVWNGCNTVPVTGRTQFNVMSAGEEMQLGLTSFEPTRKEIPISKDAAVNALVQKVGKRIAAVAELPNAQREFVVFESKEVNAFCLPGGKAGVYTGILPITKDEAGLATVLGHEIAHAVARHGGERMTEAMFLQTGGQALGASLSSADPRWQSGLLLAYGATAKLGELKFSRGHESEADHIGLVYMARAGSDPEASVQFWQRFAEFNRQHGGSGGFAFLRTHPVDEVRIQQLKEWMPQAKAEHRPGK